MDYDPVLQIVFKCTHEILCDLIRLFLISAVNGVIESGSRCADGEKGKTEYKKKSRDDNYISDSFCGPVHPSVCYVIKRFFHRFRSLQVSV